MRKQYDIGMIVMRMGDILGRGEEQGEERTRKGEKNMRKQNIEKDGICKLGSLC